MTGAKTWDATDPKNNLFAVSFSLDMDRLGQEVRGLRLPAHGQPHLPHPPAGGESQAGRHTRNKICYPLVVNVHAQVRRILSHTGACAH